MGVAVMKLAQLFQLTNSIAELKANEIICSLTTTIGFNCLGEHSCNASSYVITTINSKVETISLKSSTDEDAAEYVETLRKLLESLSKAAA